MVMVVMPGPGPAGNRRIVSGAGVFTRDAKDLYVTLAAMEFGYEFPAAVEMYICFGCCDECVAVNACLCATHYWPTGDSRPWYGV